MTKANILNIQIQPEIANKDANLEKIKNLIQKNSHLNPDLIIMPEVFNCGISHNHLQKLAEEVQNSQTLDFLRSLAVKYNSNIITGSIIEKEDDNHYNTSFLINRSGEIISKYRKIHMFDFYGSNESDYIKAGEDVVVTNTDIGKIGFSICFDLRFPKLYRDLVKKGAQIIVCPAAWPYPRLEHWLTLNKARAIENLCYFVSSNQCGKVDLKRTNVGQSMIINPWGEVVASAGSDEGIAFAQINLDVVENLRKEFPILGME